MIVKQRIARFGGQLGALIAFAAGQMYGVSLGAGASIARIAFCLAITIVVMIFAAVIVP